MEFAMENHSGSRFIACAAVLAALCSFAAPEGGAACGACAPVSVSFARGKWNPADFTVVKTPRLSYIGVFDQLDDAIVNRCPDVSPKEVFERHNDKVYSAILHKDTFGPGTTVSSTMAFDWRMAPIVVLAETLGESAAGEPEFRAHWEVCLYDRGINLWRHLYEDGRQKWYKAACILLPESAWFKPCEKHELKVKLSRNRRGLKELSVSCGGYSFTHVDETLPDTFRAGVIGCEGRNFFYDFRVEPTR